MSSSKLSKLEITASESIASPMSICQKMGCLDKGSTQIVLSSKHSFNQLKVKQSCNVTWCIKNANSVYDEN